MAAPRRYDAPHIQLGRLLLVAKAERLTFEEAWYRAVRPGKSIVMTNTPNPPEGAIRWPTDKSDRVAWQTSIADTIEGWRSAYEGWAPTEAERAVADLADKLGGVGIDDGARLASAA